MNPEKPMTPREETEMRITALLMGELSSEEAAALKAQIAADPRLAVLHARLCKAVELLREASAIPEQPAPPTPVQLSSERRERLLAHFKTAVPEVAPRPAPIVKMPPRDWSWAVSMGLAAALVALLGGSLSLIPLRKTYETPPDFSAADGELVSPSVAYAPPADAWASQPGMIRVGPRGTADGPQTNQFAYFGNSTTPVTTVTKSGSGTFVLKGSTAEATLAAVPSIASPLTASNGPSAATLNLGQGTLGVTNGNTTQTLGSLNGAGAGGGGRGAGHSFTGGIALPAGTTEAAPGSGGEILAVNGAVSSGSGISAPALPVNRNAGRIDFFDSDVDGSKLAESRTPVLGDIPVLGRSFTGNLSPQAEYQRAPGQPATVSLGDTFGAYQVQTELNGFATNAKPTNATAAQGLVGDGLVQSFQEDRKQLGNLDLNGGSTSLALSGGNTYTGAVTMTAGATSVTSGTKVTGSGGMTKSGAGTLTFGGATVNGDDQQQLQVLNGSNTYTGVTTVNGGTLSVSGGTLTLSGVSTASGAIAGSGANFDTGSGGVAAGSNTNNLTFNGNGGTVAGAPAADPNGVAVKRDARLVLASGGVVNSLGDNEEKSPLPINEPFGSVERIARNSSGAAANRGEVLARRDGAEQNAYYFNQLHGAAGSNIAATPSPSTPATPALRQPDNKTDSAASRAGLATPAFGDSSNAIRGIELPSAGRARALGDKPAPADDPNLASYAKGVKAPDNGRLGVTTYGTDGGNQRIVVGSAGAAGDKQDNPIVGRLAFWSDDDASKVNINTAGGFVSAGKAMPEEPQGAPAAVDSKHVETTQSNQKELNFDWMLGETLVRGNSQNPRESLAEAGKATDASPGRAKLAVTQQLQAESSTADRKPSVKVELPNLAVDKELSEDTRVGGFVTAHTRTPSAERGFVPRGLGVPENPQTLTGNGTVALKTDRLFRTVDELLVDTDKAGKDAAATAGDEAEPLRKLYFREGTKVDDAGRATPPTAGPVADGERAAAKDSSGQRSTTLEREKDGFANTDEWPAQAKKKAAKIVAAPVEAVAPEGKKKPQDQPRATPAPRAVAALAPAPAPAAKPVEMAKLQSMEKKLQEAKQELNAPGKPIRAEDEKEKVEALKPAPVPQPEVTTKANAFSTFSLNVSDVAFKLAAASLEQGRMPEPSTVRSEEFINAFDYRDPEPAAGVPLAFASERARYPFAQNRDLLRLSVKTAAAGRQPGRPLNIVLLLDNSGSMERADRVRILQEALRVLCTQLQKQDKLSVVTFARTPRLWADGVAGDKAAEVTSRVTEITPQGGTNIAAALDLGYATALRHYQVGSINRVVLLTDGAANLGDVNPDALKKKVEEHRRQGVALDCFGIGWEGYDDTILEALSRNGDGRYGFLNSPEEAATEFAGQLAGALHVAASDVKVQVEFNPRRVSAYRQVGYAKHQLTKQQFRDHTVDAAEIGAAESGNALYVVEVNPTGEGDLATVRVRFKVPGTSDYREHEWTVPFTSAALPLAQASPALRLAGTASAFAEWLVASPYAAEVTTDHLLGLLNGVPAHYGADPRPKKLEWMIRQAKSVSGR